MTQSNKMFKAGDRIICINDDFSNIPPLYKIIFKLPEVSKIYTIRDITPVGSYLVEEIVNDVVRFPEGHVCEPAFLYWRFKRLTLAGKMQIAVRSNAAIGNLSSQDLSWIKRISNTMHFKKTVSLCMRD